MNKGMEFSLTYEPFTMKGTIGGEVRLICSIDQLVDGRASVYEYAERLERLCDDVCKLHAWADKWSYDFLPIVEELTEEDV